MPVYHGFRRAGLQDIRTSIPLLAEDRVLYDADVWASFPALLEDLVSRDLLSFALIESLPTRTPRLLGGISFIHPEFIFQFRAGSSTLPNAVMRAALRNSKPFLSRREVGEANARGELHLLNLFGNINVMDLSDPEIADLHRTSNDGYRFFHFGYSLRAIWFEVWAEHHILELRQLGLQVDRELTLRGGARTTLLRLTREDALTNPCTRFSEYFLPPAPRFPFSPGEQRLLECALLDASDADISDELNLSEDAIKKRWRSIYVKVEATGPDLLVNVTSGAGRRRVLLHYLKHHLEELRPYRRNV